jgi:hypothetical protein
MAYRRLRSVVGGRGFLLIPAAALLVHQLRYSLAYGSQANQVLAAQGHSYLNSLAPWLVLLLALGLGSFLLRLAHTLAGRGGHRHRRSFGELWLLAWALLVLIYATQEFLEGLFAVGHPRGFAGIFGHGGWWALVAAAAFAAIVAALLQAACAIVSFAGRVAARRSFVGLPPLVARLQAVSLVSVSPLASAAAGRAPPAA